MKKELKDFAAFYLGCEVIGTYNDKPRAGYLTGVNNGGYDCEIQFFEEDGINVFEQPEFNTIAELKLILRPLSDMTEEEKFKLDEFSTLPPSFSNTSTCHWIVLEPKIIEHHAERIKFLLSKHFDIFDLIEAGLAVNAATLETVTE